MIRMRGIAATGFLFAATAAWAGESLVNGERLQYGRPYRCNGERVVVDRCRDENDSSYCQMVYPDRPEVNGMQVAPIEMRGDVVAKLNACSHAASTPSPGSPSARPAASAPAAKPSSNYAGKGKPPGVLGDASWQLLEYNEKDSIFFTPGTIKRTGHSAEGWFTDVYVRPKEAPGTQLNGAQYFQVRFVANCAKGTLRPAEAAYFDDDGNLLDGAFITEALSAFEQPKPHTWDWERLNILCGKPQRLMVKSPIKTDGLGLLFVYHGLLQQEGRM